MTTEPAGALPNHLEPGLAAVMARLVRHADRNRVALLIAHGGYKIAVGVLMLIASPVAFTGQSFGFLRLVPGGRTTMALAVLVGGALVLAGVFQHSKPWAIAGLTAIATWDFVIALGFAAAFATWQPLPGGTPQPTLYPVAVYLHLSTIMVVHVHTMLSWRSIERAVIAGPMA